MIYTRGDSGIWACQEKLLQKIHQRASAHEISTFLFTVTKVNAVQTRETSQSLSKVLSLGNEGQVRLPCLETVLVKAISTGWGFLCDCGVHMGETDEPHKFGKGIKQLDWTCSQCLRLSGEQRTCCTCVRYSMQVLQLCRMSWPVRSAHGERSSRFQLLHLWKSLSNQRKAVQPWVHL